MITDWFLYDNGLRQERVKDTHRENTPSNKTKALAKGMNMRIWGIRQVNQLFIRGSYTEILNGKTEFFVIEFILYSPFHLPMTGQF